LGRFLVMGMSKMSQMTKTKNSPLVDQKDVSYLQVWGAFFGGDYLRVQAISIATLIPQHLLRDLVDAMELVEISGEI